MGMISKRGFLFAQVALAAIGLVVIPAGSAEALEKDPNEKAVLKACERVICGIILTRRASADTVSCDLAKTWSRKSISSSAKGKSLKWGFGDARCEVALRVPQSLLVAALTSPTDKLTLPKHTIKCGIERSEGMTKVELSLSPELDLENGRVRSASLGIADIEAPALIKGAIWTVARLESTFGLFEGDLVRDINKFIEKKCPKRYPELKQ